MAVAQNPREMPEVVGENVGVRLVRSGEEVVEELLVRDARGKFRVVLMSASHPSLVRKGKLEPTAIQGMSSGLFSSPPTFGFTEYRTRKEGKDTLVILSRKDGAGLVKKIVRVPAKGKLLKVAVSVDFAARPARIRYMLASYAFAPDGMRMSATGRPDSTFSPGLRPNADAVVGDHFFRAPMISAQKGGMAALLMPDLDVLAENRPMPTILDLDCKNGVVDAPLLSYGFADHRLTGHVYFAHDASMARNVPPHLELSFDVMLNADAEPFGAYREAVPYLWERYGHTYFNRILPQAMPFADYARVCYPAAFNEAYGANKLGWFEHEIDGFVCGGIPAGWGFERGWVSWQAWFNNLRSAWGMRWWGKKLGEKDWVDKADKMLNLALAAPMKKGAVPTTYQSREKVWKGSLIMPDPRCYYDLTNMAWKGIWLLRFLEFEDCPRSDAIWKQCQEMADLMVSKQNADGSIPTWLDTELKVVPVLDHSAQTALPAWFLAEMWRRNPYVAGSFNLSGKEIGRRRSEWDKKYGTASKRAADYLVREVVDGQYYYDFETFFSCSPKQCFQRDGKVDHEAMRDMHTLQAPQNTLCMQWTAEALRAMWEVTWANGANRSSELELTYKPAAMKALDMMALYQNVWPMSYRKVAYTYGGFGVQNSDGEYLDARQAQFGCTMADFGVMLSRPDYFERGVAATRAAMTLINHPLHELLGLYPNPNYPLGLQPENCGHGGVDHQNGRTGFDWGEGSGLTSMAWLLHKYAPKFKVGGREVLVDGGSTGKEWFEANKPGPIIDPTFDFDDWRMKGWLVEGNFPEVPTWSTRMDFGIAKGMGFIGTCEDGGGSYDDEFTGTISSPSFRVTKPKMSVLVGGGSGAGVYVELVDSSGKQLEVARGKNTERMTEVVWDVSKFKGRDLQIRIVDNEKGGWGHINVGRIRCFD